MELGPSASLGNRRGRGISMRELERGCRTGRGRIGGQRELFQAPSRPLKLVWYSMGVRTFARRKWLGTTNGRPNYPPAKSCAFSKMTTNFSAAITAIPPVTRTLVGSALVISVPVMARLVPGQWAMYSSKRIFQGFQVRNNK